MEKSKKNKNKKKTDQEESKESNSDKLKTCKFIKARHILCEKQSKILEVQEKLTTDHGKTPPLSLFSELAKQYSECSSGKKGGDLGTFGRGKMVKQFETTAFDTPKGQISDIIKTEHGYHIIYVEDRTNK